MATEQTITISGTPTVVSGVTVPYANTSDLEVYIGKGKVESIEVTNAGAGYTNITFTGSAGAGNTTNSVPLVFSGGGGSAPTVRATVTNNQIDSKFWTDANGTEFTGSGGSGYTTAPNISISGLSGGTGGELTAKIYAKKTETTDYTLSGTSGNTTITFTSALANADKVLIKRATGVSTAANTFAAGSAITAEALNKSFDQIRYKVEELPNVTSTAVTNGDKGDINVSGSTWTIENDAVTGAKIADDQINSEHYVAGSIDLEHMAANSVDSDQYVDGSIDLVHMSANSVDSDQYVDGSIDLVHMSANSVDSDQYVNGSIDSVHIANGAIIASKVDIPIVQGDLIYGIGTDAWNRLPKGTAGQQLTINSGGTAPEWATPTIRSGEILETFTLPCSGSAITVGSGTYTTQNVTGVQKQVGTSYVDVTGSSITYTPPSGTQLVIYKFKFYRAAVDPNALGHFKLFLDSDEVTKARVTLGDSNGSSYQEGPATIEWPFQIAGSADTTVGKVAAGGWTSAKTIKLQYRDFSSALEIKLHETTNWDGGASSQFSIPTISITAIN